MPSDPKRMLLLTDEELDLIVAWAQRVMSGGDFEEEDEDVLTKIEAVRL